MTQPDQNLNPGITSNEVILAGFKTKGPGQHPKKTLDEEALINLLRNKQRGGYELLYDSYAAALLGVIIKILKDVTISEDVLSESFIKITSYFEQYDPARGRLFTWMINIARNLCYDKLRSKEFKKEAKNIPLDDATELLSMHSVSLDPSLTDLRDQTAKLDPNQKFLIDLAYFKGYTQSEISIEFDIPLGTVKTRLRKAINQLRLIYR
jgi:RNA polymerase sigma-70 factor (ECF subfamily)